MRRVLSAREQADLLTPWRRVAAPPLATPPEAAPAVPRGRKNIVSKDPDNDPQGWLNDSPVDYNTGRANIVSHVRGATPDQHFKGRVWYRGGHELFRDVAGILRGDRSHNLDRAITTASAFSPQTAWGDNIQHAIHFLLHYTGDHDKRHDWQTAVIHPAALQRFREKWGRDPRHTKEDAERLANQHLSRKRGGDIPGFEGLRDPEQRAEWIDNIRTRGMDNVLKRHNRQVRQSGTEDARDENGNKIPQLHPETGEPLRNAAGKIKFVKQKKAYNPNVMMAHTGVPTFGGSIKKAKDVFSNVGGAVAELLGTRKTRAFYTNLRDESPLREARTYAQAHKDVLEHNAGRTINTADGPREFREEDSPYFHQAHNPDLAHQKMDDDEGYYEMPVNPETGKRDWRLHPDVRTTIDTQHSRAITMPHGDWRATDYDQPAALAHDDGYDLYERQVHDATGDLNDEQLDPGKHLLPKQVQAIVWGKHKDENEYFGKQLGLKRQNGTPFQSPTVKEPKMKGPIDEPIANYTQDWHNMGYHLDDDRKPAPDWQNAPNLAEPLPGDYSLPAMRERHMPPLERKSFLQRVAGTLRDHLRSGEPFEWDHHLEDWITRRFPHRARLRELQASREVLAWVERVLGGR